MKKIILALAISAFSLSLASAQFFSFGVKGGLNYSSLKFDKVRDISSGNTDYHLSSDESFQGFHIGVMTRIKVFNFFIQPELYFNTAGGKVLIEELDGQTVSTEYVKQVKYNKIDLPVLAGVKFGPLRLNAGPVASVILSEDSEIGDIIPDLNTLSKSASIGFQAGAGLDILKFLTLDYRFEGGLSKWGDQLKIGGEAYPFDSRANMHLISVGIMF